MTEEELADLEFTLAKLVLENQQLKEEINKLTRQLNNARDENRGLESQVFGGSTF